MDLLDVHYSLYSDLSPALLLDACESSPWMDSRPDHYFTVSGAVSRWIPPPCLLNSWAGVRSLSTEQCGALSRQKMCPWMFPHKGLLSLRAWRLLSWRNLPCDDPGSMGGGIQMSAKLECCVSLWKWAQDLCFPTPKVWWWFRVFWD